MSKIFISHSSANNAHALAVAQWLQQSGWDDYFLDVEPTRGLAPGERWQDALKQAAHRCEAVLFLISPAWRDSRWCLAEFLLAKQLGKTIFGVLIEATKLETLPPEMSAEWQLCDLVTGIQRQSFRVAYDAIVPETVISLAEAGLARLKVGLKRAGLDPSSFPWPPPNDPDRAPYRGLKALEAKDAAVFFGRDAAIVRGLDALRSMREQGVERSLLILGASGSGKSSFLRAGLWPRLARDDLHFLPMPVIRPGRGVINEGSGLLVSLETAFSDRGVLKSRAALRETLEKPDGLMSLLTEIQQIGFRSDSYTPLPTVVICVDQGEELQNAEGRSEANHFLAMLAHALKGSGFDTTSHPRLRPPILAVTCIRSESFERLQREPALEGTAKRLFDLSAIPRSEFKMAIEGPAARATAAGRRLDVQPALTERLLHDTEGPDALPLLAFTLERLYVEHGAAGELQLKQYEAMGGVQGSIEAAIAAAFDESGREPMAPADKAKREGLLRQAFIPWLAGVDPQTEERKRRVARWDEIPPAARPLVERLIAARLLLRDRRKVIGADKDVVVVEVAHEALLRQWPTLTSWLDADADALKLLSGVQNAASEWEKNTRGEVWLVHAGERLASAEGLRAREDFVRILGTSGTHYLAECRAREDRAHREREAQRKRVADAQWRISLLLSAVAVVVVVAGTWIVAQTRELGRQTSLVLTDAGTRAVNDQFSDRGLRFGVLAARESFLSPAHPYAAPELARAASASLALAEIVVGAAVVGASFSSDGKLVVTASEDDRARIWDAETGQLVGAPFVHTSEVHFAQFNPDGSRIVTISGETGDWNNVMVWDVATGQPVGPAFRHEALSRNSARFSPDGKHVVTKGRSNDARSWDVATGQVVGVALKTGLQSTFADISLDGKRVITLSGDNKSEQIMRVWDAATGIPVAGPMRHARGSIKSAQFSPDGSQVLTISEDNRSEWTARLWYVVSGKLVGKPLRNGQIVGAGVSRDGKRVLTSSLLASKSERGDEDKNPGHSVRVWDAEKGEVRWETSAHGDTELRPEFSSDGRRVATYLGRNAYVWDAETGEPLSGRLRHELPVNSVQFSPDGKRIVSASFDNTARVWDVNTRHNLLLTLGQKKDLRIGTIEFSSDGKWIVSSIDKKALVWNAQTGEPVGAPLVHDATVTSARFSDDSNLIVTASIDKTARVWNAKTQPPVGKTLPHTHAVDSARLTPDGKWVVTIDRPGNYHLWNLETAELLDNVLKRDVGVVVADISLDGKRVITLSGDKETMRVRDAATGNQVGKPMKHASGSAIEFAEFSPDGKRVLAILDDNTGQVWDVEGGKALGATLTHDLPVKLTKFSRDGRRVITIAGDNHSENTARVWDAATGKPVGEPIGHGFFTGIDDAEFSPDGKRVLTVAGRVLIWDIETGQQLGEFEESAGSAKFSPDGKRIVTSSGKVWDASWAALARSSSLLSEVCRTKLRGALRRISSNDVRAAPILGEHVGKDVCAGIEK